MQRAIEIVEQDVEQKQPYENEGRRLSEKKFVARNSLLTDLFRINHFQTIHNMFMVASLFIFLNTVVYGLVDRGSINLGLGPIIAGFGNILEPLLLWICMQLCVFCIYPSFVCWAHFRRFFLESCFRHVWDIGAIFGLILYQCSFMTIVIAAVLLLDFAPASSIAVLMEMVRFMLKTHAFIRSNTPRAIETSKQKTTKHEVNNNAGSVPSFSKFLYFLFAPTLIYRDEYPRTKRVRWSFVCRHITELVTVIFCFSFTFEQLLFPLFQHFGSVPISLGEFVLMLFGSVLPGALILLCTFYGLLHAWLNAIAELLRFADRLFYRDWWNASSFAEYMRSWNVVVNDWLYFYVYKDLVEHCLKNCRPLVTIALFTLSALVHEIIVSFSFRFFYPVMFVQFEFFGLLLMIPQMRCLNKVFGNILLWFLLCTGLALQTSLYSMEYFARKNCRVSSGESLVDYVVPVSWRCNGIASNSSWTLVVPWST